MNANPKTTQNPSVLQRLIEAANDAIEEHSAHVERTDPEVHARLVALSKVSVIRRVVIEATDGQIMVTIGLGAATGEFVTVAEFRATPVAGMIQ